MNGRTLLGALLAGILLMSLVGCETWCEHRYPCQQPCAPAPCCQAPYYQQGYPPTQPLQPIPITQPPANPCTPCAPTGR